MPRTIITSADLQGAIMLRSQPIGDSEAIRELGVGPLEESESERSLQNVSGNVPDSYLDKLIKYIPSEVVALYLSLDAICRSAPTEGWLRWPILILGVVMTPLYLWRVQSVTKIIQLVVSTLSFVVWTVALGGPFIELSWYKPIYGALLLPIFTFLVPLIDPGKNRLQ